MYSHPRPPHQHQIVQPFYISAQPPTAIQSQQMIWGIVPPPPVAHPPIPHAPVYAPYPTEYSVVYISNGNYARPQNEQRQVASRSKALKIINPHTKKDIFEEEKLDKPLEENSSQSEKKCSESRRKSSKSPKKTENNNSSNSLNALETIQETEADDQELARSIKQIPEYIEKKLANVDSEGSYKCQDEMLESTEKSIADTQTDDSSCTDENPLSQDEIASPILSEPNRSKSTAEICDEPSNDLSREILSSTIIKEEEYSIENQFHKYTIRELRQMKKSSIVSCHPPEVKGSLLTSSLNESVWKTLFDKSVRFDDSSYHDLSNNRSHNISRREMGNRSFQNDSKKHSSRDIVHISLNQSIKLNEAKNAWKPSMMKPQEYVDEETQELIDLERSFRLMLNKITVDNYEILVGEIKTDCSYIIDTPRKLVSVIDILFEKSTTEKFFCPLYARLCKTLAQLNIVQSPEDTRKNIWKSALISRCQQEFEKYASDAAELDKNEKAIAEAETPERKEELHEEFYLYRAKASNTIIFIGHLYIQDLLTTNIMQKCVGILFGTITEENLSRVCKLLTVIGSKLEPSITTGKPIGTTVMDSYMKRLAELMNSDIIKNRRVKFDIMNLIDLHKAKWKPRASSKINQADQKTLKQIEDETNQERIEKEQQNQAYESSHHNNRRHNGSLQGTSSFNNGKNRQQNQNQNKARLQNKAATESMGIWKHGSLVTTNSGGEKLLPSWMKNREGSFNKESKSEGAQSNLNLKEETKVPIMNAWQTIKMTDNKVPIAKTQDATSIVANDSDSDDEKDDASDMISDAELEIFEAFKSKLNAFIKCDVTYNLNMLITDTKKLNITKNVLAKVYNTILDSNKIERKLRIDTIIDLIERGVISRKLNLSAIISFMKTLPDVAMDVPQAWSYAGAYFVQMYDAKILSINDIKKVCKRETNVKTLNYVMHAIDDRSETSVNLLQSTTSLIEPSFIRKSEHEFKALSILEKYVEKSNNSINNTFIDHFTDNNNNNESVNIPDVKKIEYLISKQKDIDVIYTENCLDCFRSNRQFIRNLTQRVSKMKGKSFTHGCKLLQRLVHDVPYSQLEVISEIIDLQNGKSIQILKTMLGSSVVNRDIVVEWCNLNPKSNHCNQMRELLMQ